MLFRVWQRSWCENWTWAQRHAFRWNHCPGPQTLRHSCPLCLGHNPTIWHQYMQPQYTFKQPQKHTLCCTLTEAPTPSSTSSSKLTDPHAASLDLCELNSSLSQLSNTTNLVRLLSFSDGSNAMHNYSGNIYSQSLVSWPLHTTKLSPTKSML